MVILYNNGSKRAEMLQERFDSTTIQYCLKKECPTPLTFAQVNGANLNYFEAIKFITNYENGVY